MSDNTRMEFGKDADGTNPSNAVEPTGNTVDGEVVPVEFGVQGVAQPDTRLSDAIAAHFGIEPEALTGFVLSAEYNVPEGSTLSSAWSLGVPVWRLRAFAQELRRHLEGA